LFGAYILHKGFSTTMLYIALSLMALIAVISLAFTRKPLPHDELDVV
jgi:hypothetical protein